MNKKYGLIYKTVRNGRVNCYIKQKTKVPILLNTSFNLGGEPLVETFDDAIRTLKKSDINYLYLPEIRSLITVHKAY